MLGDEFDGDGALDLAPLSSIGMTNFREKTWSDPVLGASQMTAVDNSIGTLYTHKLAAAVGKAAPFWERLGVRHDRRAVFRFICGAPRGPAA